MSEQPTLFGDTAAPAPLPLRQRAVLDALQVAGHDGLRADEAGATIHAYRGTHDVGLRCDWCAREGGEVLKRLRELGKARRDRHGNWRAADAPDGRPGPGELPEGF